MTYTISEVAEKTGLTTYTLRYYDKEGLMPFVDRTPSGIRKFKDDDFEWLSVITCLKKTGMPIKEIRDFIGWCIQGDVSLKKRLALFKEHQRQVEKQIVELERYKKKIDHKVWYYETAVDAGTESIHKNSCELPDDEL